MPAQSWSLSLGLLAVIFGLYFVFPANLWVYGVNDIFDYETDRLNSKKQGFELVLEPRDHRKIWRTLLAWNLPFWALAIIFLPLPAVACLFGFLFFGTFYSAPPIRAKTKPFLDMLFNVLYAFPGFMAAALLGGTTVLPLVIIAATAWCMAMHAYSAVPDITADTRAKMKTVATVLGLRGTLVLCAVLYALATVTAAPYLGQTPFILGNVGAAALYGGIYVLLMVLAIAATRNQAPAAAEAVVFRLYKRFPLTNGLIGMAIFFQLAGLYLLRS
jgi:lycopene elongase/hydratase (dihydrobisanhydrobacterioruberin-forming)